MKQINYCTTDNCERRVHGHGMCSMHYKRAQKYGVENIDKTPDRKKYRVCSLDDCDKKHDSYGYCANHARVFKRHGRIPSREEYKKSISDKRKGNKINLGKHWKIAPEKRLAAKGICKNTGRTHFGKGFTPWNKGTVGVMVAWNRGLIGVIKNKNKGKKTGRIPWNKIGDGITNKNKIERAKFNKSYAKEVLVRDNYTCQICMSKGGHLHVDHIVRWSQDESLRFDINNCRTLCRACHYCVTFKKIMPENSTWGLSSVARKRG